MHKRSHQRRARWRGNVGRWIIVAALCASAHAQQTDTQRILENEQIKEVSTAFDRGIYERVAKACDYVIAQGAQAPEWHLFLVRSLVANGKAEEAIKMAERAARLHANELPVLLLRQQTLEGYGRKDEAQTALKSINDVARKIAPKDRKAADLVALGQAALAAGADPAKVLQQYLTPAKRKDVKLEAAYLASGDLALKHSDYAKAANEFRAGLKEHGESPELRFGLARAFASGDRGKSLEYLDRVLETNPHHEAALVLKAEHLIGAEKFAEAEITLAGAIETNEHSAGAWALRSVIAMLQDNDPAKASTFRTQALTLWDKNPEVDHQIGKCLSRAYRFAEGAQQQREVLALNPDFMPAKLQLASDLMRLGQTEEAWKLASEVRAADAYNTQAHNLGLLETEMGGYHVEKADDFILRMPLRDWQVYGGRALQLLREARAVLAPKYGHTFTKPTMVEFFPSQQDFAIRTFGALGGQGLLGVCFGTVITMNSPGSLAHGRSNWEATLWHEFCHVVTLSVTNNRMPRWLSEGISVYEERQRDPAWGMRMTADYRRMILEDNKLTPLGQMSGAFLNAKDGDEIMFAYYQSSMAVEWLVSKHGWEALRKVLADLATGDRINTVLEKNMGPMEQLEPQFLEFMTAQAKAYAPQADWSKLDPALADEPAKLADFIKANPNHLEGLALYAEQLAADKAWDQMAEVGQRLIDLNPEDVSASSGYWVKGKALHQLKKVPEETALLRVMAAKSSDSMPVFLRLMELDAESKSMPELEQDAARAFAINPFLPQPTQSLATAAEAQGKADAALASYQRLLLLNPPNPALVRFKLATLLQSKDAAQAKRLLLDALVLAPRYREALDLLKSMP